MKEELRKFLDAYKKQKVYLDKNNNYKDGGKNFIDWYVDESGYLVKTCDLADVGGALPDLVRSKVVAEIEREYGKFSELDEDRKDNFYLMLGIIDNALKQ